MAKSDDILKRTKDLLTQKASEKEFERTRVERERQQLVTSLGQEIARIIAPAINNLAQSQQVTFNKMRQMLREIKVEAPKIPPINIPEIKVPQPKVQVNVPDVKVPQFEVPKPIIEFPASMQVTMDQYDSKRPLPVMMMGTDGKPMSFSMGASGGKADFLTIKDIRNSTGGSIISNDGALKVEGNFGAALSVDYGSGEIGSATQRIVQATDAISSVYVTGANGTIGVVTIDPDGNPTYASATSGLTDAELRASSVPVAQISDAVWSTYVTGASGTIATYMLDGDGEYRDVIMTDMSTALDRTIDSISVAQVSDGNFSVYVTGAGGTLATNMVDSSGEAYSGSNPVPVTGTVVVSSVTASTASALVDSSGVAYSGSNPVPTVAKQVNVRGSMATAYATISSDAATTVLAGVASTYLDMVYVMGANQSDGAVTLDFYTGAGGATMLSLEIPANSTAGVAPVAPIPMTEAAQAWYVYYADSDVTGTTVDITALFTKEV